MQSLVVFAAEFGLYSGLCFSTFPIQIALMEDELECISSRVRSYSPQMSYVWFQPRLVVLIVKDKSCPNIWKKSTPYLSVLLRLLGRPLYTLYGWILYLERQLGFPHSGTLGRGPGRYQKLEAQALPFRAGPPTLHSSGQGEGTSQYILCCIEMFFI